MIISAKKYILFSFSLLFLISSCKDNNPSVLLIKQAQDEVFSNPSYAVELLDSIESPEAMDKENYMLYIVTLVQAKYNDNQDITVDTLIFDAQNYFNERNDYPKAALANFYAGTVYWSKDIPDKALKSFLFAKGNSQQTKDKKLEAKSIHALGYIYYQQNMMDSAIVRYKEALQNYDNEPESVNNRLMLLSDLGRSYEISNNLDSAYNYFSKAMVLAENTDNKRYKAIEAYNLGFVLLRKKEYQKAKGYFNNAIQQSTSTVDSLKIFLNYSLLYTKTQQLDSAKYYIDVIYERLAEISDKQLLKSIYGSMSEYYSQTGNDKQALYYKEKQRKTEGKIAQANQADKLIKAETNHRLYIQKQEQKAERNQLLLIQGIIILAIIAVAYFIHLKRRHKDRQRLMENKRLKAENRLLKKEYDNHIYLESIYKEFILKWSEIEDNLNNNAIGEDNQPSNYLLYSEIKPIVDELKNNSNNQLLKVAIEYLNSHSHIGDKAVRFLTEQELILIILCCFEYSHAAIAKILDIELEKLDLEERKLRIKTRLRNAGMDDQDIDFILYS